MTRKTKLKSVLKKAELELELINNIDKLEDLSENITYFTRRYRSYYAKDYVLDLMDIITEFQDLISDEEGIKYLTKIYKYVKKQTKQLIEERLDKLNKK